MSAETPGTSATTWLNLLDCGHAQPQQGVATLTSEPRVWCSRCGWSRGITAVLVDVQVVAAREAAAREEGRAEVRDAAHLVAESHAEQIRQLRAEASAAEKRLDAVRCVRDYWVHSIGESVWSSQIDHALDGAS